MQLVTETERKSPSRAPNSAGVRDAIFIERALSARTKVEKAKEEFLGSGADFDEDRFSKLTDAIRNYLFQAPQEIKFENDCVKKCIHDAALSVDYNPIRTSHGFKCVMKYCLNLIRQPWRKEFQVINLQNGFYYHEISSKLENATELLFCIGFEEGSGSEILFWNKERCNDELLHSMLLDCLFSWQECLIISEAYSRLMHFHADIDWTPRMVYEHRCNKPGDIHSICSQMVFNATKGKFQNNFGAFTANKLTDKRCKSEIIMPHFQRSVAVRRTHSFRGNTVISSKDEDEIDSRLHQNDLSDYKEVQGFLTTCQQAQRSDIKNQFENSNSSRSDPRRTEEVVLGEQGVDRMNLNSFALKKTDPVSELSNSSHGSCRAILSDIILNVVPEGPDENVNVGYLGTHVPKELKGVLSRSSKCTEVPSIADRPIRSTRTSEESRNEKIGKKWHKDVSTQATFDCDHNRNIKSIFSSKEPFSKFTNDTDISINNEAIRTSSDIIISEVELNGQKLMRLHKSSNIQNPGIKCLTKSKMSVRECATLYRKTNSEHRDHQISSVTHADDSKWLDNFDLRPRFMKQQEQQYYIDNQRFPYLKTLKEVYADSYFPRLKDRRKRHTKIGIRGYED